MGLHALGVLQLSGAGIAGGATGDRAGGLRPKAGDARRRLVSAPGRQEPMAKTPTTTAPAGLPKEKVATSLGKRSTRGAAARRSAILLMRDTFSVMSSFTGGASCQASTAARS